MLSKMYYCWARVSIRSCDWLDSQYKIVRTQSELDMNYSWNLGIYIGFAQSSIISVCDICCGFPNVSKEVEILVLFLRSVLYFLYWKMNKYVRHFVIFLFVKITIWLLVTKTYFKDGEPLLVEYPNHDMEHKVIVICDTCIRPGMRKKT